MKPTVQYDGYVGFQQRTKKIDMLDAYEYAKLSYDGHNNAYLDLLESKGIPGSITDTNDERNAKLGRNLVLLIKHICYRRRLCLT